MAFQDVPTELTEHILTFCHARDVAKVAQTCKQLHALVYDSPDQYLWRELFLLYPFDDLRKSVPSGAVSSSTGEEEDAAAANATVDWRGALQRRVYAETVAVSEPGTYSLEEQQDAFAALVSAVHTSLPYQPLAPGQVSQAPSNNLTWLYDVLKHSPVMRNRDLSDPKLQLCCQLRSFLSLSLDDTPGTGDSESSNEHLQDIRSTSRCAVYNLSKYTMKNLWGPFLPVPSSPSPRSCSLSTQSQPKVNWEQVEHIMNVVVMNMRELEGTPYSLMRPQLGLDPTRAYSAPGTGDLRENGSRDWAGLEGLWRRFVCFMDYRCVVGFVRARSAFIDCILAESCLVSIG